MVRIGMIGLGKLGLPCAEVFADHFDIEGFDVRPVTPAKFRMVDSIARLCWDKDVVFLAVPTPHDPDYGGATPSAHLAPKDFDYRAVSDVLQEIDRVAVPGQVVGLISTVLPGTVRREFSRLATNYSLIYNPYLIAMGSVEHDMRNPEMLIIGTEDGGETNGARLLIDLYKRVVRNRPRIAVGTWEEAECIKIFYNTFISAKISLVNMIQDVAEQLHHIDADVVANALKASNQRITGPAYMTPGMGDGGACHPRDNIALRWLAHELDLGYDLFGTIMASREGQARNMARALVGLADAHSLSSIWIHGKSYKPRVGLTDGSYSLLVGHYVRSLDRAVDYVDPLTGDHQARIRGVVLMAHSPAVTYGNDSCADSLYCDIEPGSVIVDPWRSLSSEAFPGCTVVHFGNTRPGSGREAQPRRRASEKRVSQSAQGGSDA